MTLYAKTVQRARILLEANGSFGTDGSGTLGNYLGVPFVEGTSTLKLNHPMESPRHAQQHHDGLAKRVALVKDAEWTVSIPLETFTTRATNGVAAVQGALGMMLEFAMGGNTTGTGRLTSSSTTTTSVPMASVSGFSVGGAVGFATGTGSTLEIREIKNNASTTITPKHAVTGAPGTSATAYGADTYYMGNTDGSQTQSLQAILEGLNPNDRWLCSGGYLKSMSFDQLGPGALPRVTFTVGFADWDLADGSATVANLATGTLGIATYTNNNTVVVKDSEFRIFTVGATTLSSTTLIHAPMIEFKPAITYALHRTPAGTNTVKQAVRTHTAPVISGSFTVPYEDTTWRTARDAGTDKAIFLQIGSSTTQGAVLLAAPCTQIIDVQETDMDGIAGLAVSWEGRLDTDTVTSGLTGTDYDRAVSALRVHLV